MKPEFGLRKMLIIETITTVEMKWGMYVMVCTKPLIFLEPIWLISRARMIGQIKPITKVERLMLMVLRIKLTNCGDSKNFWKYFRPTNVPPVKPCGARTHGRKLNAVHRNVGEDEHENHAGNAMSHSCQ